MKGLLAENEHKHWLENVEVTLLTLTNRVRDEIPEQDMTGCMSAAVADVEEVIDEIKSFLEVLSEDKQ